MINKDMRIFDVLQNYPESATIFEQFGMGCIGCMGVTMESIENGAKMHKIPLEKLLTALNESIKIANH